MTRNPVSGRRPSLILGIDPGTAVTGWGLIRKDGNRLSCQGWGAWKTKAGDPLPQRLALLSRELEALIKEHRPDGAAIEQAFLGKNIQSTLRVGEARGALMVTCAREDLALWEYPTATVKKAVVGNGRADKTQMQFMLQRLLKLDKAPEPLDASDALGLAFTLAMDWNIARVADTTARRR